MFANTSHVYTGAPESKRNVFPLVLFQCFEIWNKDIICLIVSTLFLCLTADVCDPNPCGTHGTCAHDTVNIGGFTCTCDGGWTGSNCQIGKNGE